MKLKIDFNSSYTKKKIFIVRVSCAKDIWNSNRIKLTLIQNNSIKILFKKIYSKKTHTYQISYVGPNCIQE